MVLESPVDDDMDEFVGAVYDRKPYIGQVLELDDESMYVNYGTSRQRKLGITKLSLAGCER